MNNQTRYKDWAFAREVLQLINRDWALELNPLDLRAVYFVFDRTIGWCKEWEVITRDQAAQGVWDKETGKCYAAPITRDRARAFKVLTRLEEKGFLKSEKAGKSTKYSLNLKKKIGTKRLIDPETGALTPLDKPRALPKRSQSDTKDSTNAVISSQNKGVLVVRKRVFEGCENAFRGSAKTHPKEKENNKRVNQKTIGRLPSSNASHSGEGNPERENPPFQKIEKVSEKSNSEKLTKTPASIDRAKADSRTSRAAKPKNGAFRRNLHDVQSGFVPYQKWLVVAWRDLTLEHFDNAQPTTTSAKHAHVLYQYALTWTKARNEGEFMDYLKWIFERWDAFRVSVFSWMKDFPITPSQRWRGETEPVRSSA